MPFASCELSDDDASHSFQLPDLLEVEELAVELDRCAVRVLEEEDRAVQVHLPGRADRVDEAPEIAPDQAATRPAADDGKRGEALPILRYGPGPVALKDFQQAIGSERGNVGLSEHRQTRAVEGRKLGKTKQRGLKRRDVRGADECLRTPRDCLEVEQRNDLRRAVAATHALDRVDVRVGEHLLQVTRPDLGTSCMPVALLQCSTRQLHVITLRLPPTDAALHLSAALRWAARSADPDRRARRCGP